MAHWFRKRSPHEETGAPAAPGLFSRLLATVLTVAVLGLGGVVYMRLRSSEPMIRVSSVLTDVIEIDELSTAEYVYNGIAEVRDENPDQIRFYVRYDSKISIGVRMQDVRIESIDEEKKKITVSLPQVEILGNPIIDDRTLSFMKPGTYSIFSPSDFDLQAALKAAKQDALTEAAAAEELYVTARENLETTIQALLLPVLGNGYTFEWQDAGGLSSEGGARE